MPKFTLIPYEKTSAPTLTFDSELNTNAESLYISYKLQGDLGNIHMGAETPKHSRVMKLWEKTCFELFLKNDQNNYIEFNFSPEFEWNCFYFEKKGDALLEYKKMDAVKFDILLSNDVVHAIVEIDKNKFPDGFFKGTLSVGITSVVKEKNGNLSYWALSHHDIKPNFHDFRSFNGSLK